MTIKHTIVIAIRSLSGKKIRTFLTSFAIFIGVCIIIILVSLSNGAQKILISQITNQFDLRTIFVLRPGSLSTNFFTTTVQEEKVTKIIDNQSLEKIRLIQNIEFVDPVINIPSKKIEFEDKNFDSRVANNVSGGAWNLRETDNVVTELFAGKYTNLQKNEIILTKDLVDAYGKTAEEVIGKTIVVSDQIGSFGNQFKPTPPRKYIVAGVVNKIRNFVFILSLDEGLSILSERNGYNSVEDYINTAGYQSLYVKATKEEHVKNIANEIRKEGFDVSTLEDILSLFNVFFSIVPLIFTLIGGIAVFVASIGIANTMLMSVFERTKEIGILKAIGAKNKDILLLFITESGIIGLIGGILALIVSIILISIGNNIFVEKIVPKVGLVGHNTLFVYDINLFLATLLASTIVGIIAGIYPAYRASKLNPVDALRAE
ncbi:MAG: ABC transporter permease [Candidatus Dojkabacteria bacterium]|nr:ABC transporter permease [Candidatus Dojkabacteria bacterium]